MRPPPAHTAVDCAIELFLLNCGFESVTQGGAAASPEPQCRNVHFERRRSTAGTTGTRAPRASPCSPGRETCRSTAGRRRPHCRLLRALAFDQPHSEIVYRCRPGRFPDRCATGILQGLAQSADRDRAGRAFFAGGRAGGRWRSHGALCGEGAGWCWLVNRQSGVIGAGTHGKPRPAPPSRARFPSRGACWDIPRRRQAKATEDVSCRTSLKAATLRSKSQLGQKVPGSDQKTFRKNRGPSLMWEFNQVAFS